MFYIYADGKMIYHLANPELYLNQPKLTLEMGKAGSLEFGIMPDHAFYDRLSQLTTVVTVDYDDTEIFRGRVLSNTRDFQNMRQIYCEGNLSYLVDTVQKFDKYNGTVHDLFRKIITGHNTRIKDATKQFTVGNITVENRSVKLTGQSDEVNVGNIDYKQIALNSIVDEWNTTYDLIQTCIIDYVGGYLNTRHQNGVTYIDLLVAPSNTSENTTTQEIELGVNMLDLEEEVSAEDLFTVLIPLGDDNLTIKSVNNGSDELVDTAAVAKYGRIVKTHVFSNVNEASTLKENGQRLLASSINIPTTLTINALDKHIVNKAYDPIHICDRVHIKSTRHGIVEYLTCTKIEYDLENPGNDTYTFGNPTQTLTQRYREDKRKESDTYGNSGSGGHGGGGGAAADAVEAAAEAGAEEVEDKLNVFYTSYIDLDPSDGDVSLGATYKRLQKMHNVLSGWGINADAGMDSQGNIYGAINLNTFYEQHTVLGNIVNQNTADISMLSDSTGSRITMLATAIADETDRAEAIEASITARASSLESEIVLKADKTTLDSAVTTITGRLEAAEGAFDNLIAGRTVASSLRATMLATENMSITGTLTHSDGYGYALAYGDHSHTMTANDDGTVTIGYSSGREKGSFNIADTNFYKNGVSAAKQSVRVNDIRKNPDQNVSYGSSSKTIYYPVQANTTEYATYHHNVVLNVPGDDAYDAGVNSVTIGAIGATWNDKVLTVSCKASNGAAATPRDIDCTWLYTSGVSAGEAKFESVSVSIPTYSGQYWYSAGSSYSYSGSKLGSAYSIGLYYKSGSNYYPWNTAAGGSNIAYRDGGSYSYSGTEQGTRNYINVVTGSSSKTYYRKK